MDNVCNRCLFSIPSKVEMAEEQEYLRSSFLFLIICPIRFHLRHLISSLALFTPVIAWIRWHEMVRGQLILSMRLMHLYWKASGSFASLFVSFQASQPYIKTALTIVLNNIIEFSSSCLFPNCSKFFATCRKFGGTEN